MSDFAAHVKVTATAEVRDKDGNLISSTPVEFDKDCTADELAALGYEAPTEKEK